MKTETREVYRCDYCGKLYQVKRFCLAHEKGCYKRPDYIRPCHNCEILKKIEYTIRAGYGDEYGNEQERVVNVLFCEKIDSFIHPPSVAAKGNAFVMDKHNIEMPKECEFKIDINYDDVGFI